MSKKYKRFRALSEKWHSVDKDVVLVSAIVLSMFIMSWLVFIFHLQDIAAKYKELINTDIEAQVENSSIKIAGNITDRCDYFASSAWSLSNQDDLSDEEVTQILTSLQESGKYSLILYTDTYCRRMFSYDGKDIKEDIRDYVYEYNGFSDYVIIDNVTNLGTENKSFVIVAPVKSSYKIIGYLLGVVEYSSIDDNALVREEVTSDTVILDRLGNVVFLIRNGVNIEIKEVYNFFDNLSIYTSGTDFTSLSNGYEESIKSGESVVVSAESGGRNIKYHFYPVKNNSRWSVITCIDEDSIQAIVNKMLARSVVMFLIIIIFMVVAALAVIRHIQKEQKKVSNLEFLDGLTGIMNRNAFTTRAQEILKENKNLPFYIACFDVVNFRIINETYGHERSDVIIKSLAEACKEAFGKNEIYGRLNADVFVALVVNDGEELERISFLESKVKEAAKSVYINHPIKLKKGFYEVIDYSEPVSRMIDKANIARKYIESNSKSLVCKYADELMDSARKNDIIESQMEYALASGEFRPFLQAKYDMEKNHICGAEALVRWIKSDGTVVPPGDFIPLFEKNGFVEKIDFFMLEAVCRYLRRMIDENREVYPVSVNQSRYLLNDPDYVNKVRDILLKYKIPIGLIELEITETVFFHERERMIEMMNELKEINVNLSIDDFGSGYSSFSLLKDVPFDVLKIDREFLSDSVHTEKGKWILKEIVEMAVGLGMSVICEGVETREQAEMLLSIGCKKAQGFLYARPIPLHEHIEKYNLVKGV